MHRTLILLLTALPCLFAADIDITYPQHVRTPEQQRAWRIGWPQWGGPFGNKSAIDCGYELVTDLKSARLVWENDEKLPPVGFGSGGGRGGFASPMMSDGRVVIFYYVGAETGTVVDKDLREKLQRNKNKYALDEATIEQFCKIEADEIILCVEAATGKTLWKEVHEKAGYNDQEASAKNGGHFTPCIRHGRVIAAGTTGRVYCHDAVTGKELWQADTGWSHEALEQMKAAALAAGDHKSSRGTKAGLSNGAPLITAGVAIVLDGPNVLHGFDLETGKKLWKTDSLGHGKRNSSIAQLWWRGEDQLEYILYAGNEVYCIDPRDGSIVWSIPGHEAGNNVVASPTHMIVDGIGDKHDLTRAATKNGTWQQVTDQLYGPCIYQISPQGVKLVKRFDVSYMIKGLGSPAIYQGRAFWSTDWVFGRHHPDHPTFIASVDLETGESVQTITSHEVGHQITQVYQGVLAEGRYFHTTGYDQGWFATEKLSLLSYSSRKDKALKMAQDTSPIYACGAMVVRGPDSLLCYDVRAQK